MRRVAVLAAVLAVAMAPPALAHGTGGDGGGGAAINVPVVVFGAIVAATGVSLRARPHTSPFLVWGLVAAGLAVGAVGLATGDSGDNRPDVHLAVIEPVEASTVPAGEPVDVIVSVSGEGRVATSPSDTEGGHLHLSIDGDLEQMPYGQEAKVTLPAGRHTLTVEYVDAKHVSYDPPIEQTIAVTAR